MDHIEILFKEYDMLRAEMIMRTNHGHQIVSIGTVAVATLAGWFATHQTDRLFWIVCGVFLVALGVSSYIVFADMAPIAKRLRELESKINHLAGAPLLEWETKYDGGVIGRLFRRK